jgi:hypothetical protein
MPAERSGGRYVKINEFSGHVEVLRNYGDGQRLVYSVPTGSGAAYPAAVASNRAECDAKINAYVADLRSRFPDLIVIDNRAGGIE